MTRPSLFRPLFSGLAAFLLLGFVGSAQAAEPESSEEEPVAEGEAPGAQATAGVSHRGRAALTRRPATRKDLLERIRREGEDPATAFLPVEADQPETLVLSPEEQREIDLLIASILTGLEIQDTERVLAALSEAEVLDPESSRSNFGAVDELSHPSTDIYSDPVRAMAKRPNLHLELVDARDFDYPVILNTQVQAWMVYLLTRGRKYFVRWLARAERYEPLIVPKLEAAGLPKDLLYQAMIESGFNPYATSRAAAVGVWQFIASTGEAYGLERNWWIDERRDPVMATESAIAFMTDLYKRFENWELASAAYNAGGGKISKGLRTYQIDDYWEMATSDRDFLANETKNYVPKMVAAAVLGKYPERYGLDAEIREQDLLTPWDFDVAVVPEATDLRLVARLVGVEFEELESMNPALRRGFTPAGVENYRLNLPKGSSRKFKREFAKVPRSERTTFVRHPIAKGQTLGSIAELYSVPSATLAELNEVDDPRSLKVGRRLLIPVRPDELGSRTLTHVVDRGETLTTLALRYKTTVDELKKRNKLKGDLLKVGQQLKIEVKGSGKIAATSGSRSSSKSSRKSRKDRRSSSKARGKKVTWHTVKSGDTLYRIADLHSLAIDELLELNKLKKNSVIHPGQRLRVQAEPKGPRLVTYTVQSGDTVWAIARKHEMSVDDFRKANGMKDNNIHPGQKLKVKAGASTSSSSSTTKKVAKTHVVVAGDTLSEIAEHYSVKMADLRLWNSLKDDKIKLGQTLSLRAPKSSKASTSKKRTVSYKVKSGDTLGEISEKYGVTVRQLMSWNDLKNHVITPGQVLRIGTR